MHWFYILAHIYITHTGKRVALEWGLGIAMSFVREFLENVGTLIYFNISIDFWKDLILSYQRTINEHWILKFFKNWLK